MKWSRFTWVFWPAALLVVGWMLFDDDRQGKAQDEQRIELRDSVYSATYLRLQTEHAAIPAYPDDTESFVPNFSSIFDEPRPWVLDRQRRWVQGQQPIILQADLLDLAQDSLGYVADFRVMMVTYGNTSFLKLRVSQATVDLFTEERQTLRSSYAKMRYLIVATITAVQPMSAPAEYGFWESSLIGIGELVAVESFRPFDLDN